MRVILIIISFFYILNADAQVLNVEAELDTNAILVGEQTKYFIRLTHPVSIPVNPPLISDTITGKIEVVGKPEIDSMYSSDSSSVTEVYKYTITSFDSGYYPIPPLKIFASRDSDIYAETPALLLQVSIMDVDTTQGFKDIKPPLEAPFSWKELIPYSIAIILLAIITWLVIRFIRNRKKVKPVIQKIPERPAHEIALEELNILEEEKLWQKGNYKLYHIRLTDILRDYLARRFAIHAQEYTTEEILSSTRTLAVESSQSKLRQVLILADLVKFAKETPVSYENELSMKNAIEFINETRIELNKKEVKDEPI